jgi:hypothetical protein
VRLGRRLALVCVLATTLLGVLAGALGTGGAVGAVRAAPSLPPIKHVFIIVLENESASVTFGPSSPAPYLSSTLRSEGAYLPNYHGVGHASLDNYIAMISGQAPNTITQEDCPTFSDIAPGTLGANGQAEGEGCVYPSDVPTIVSQLTSAGLTWRDYNDGMGADPTRESSVCGHPPVGSPDNTESATATDQYATRHDPFVYFHAIIDDTTLCDTNVVNLDALPADLASAAKTPNYVFITPNLCDDGHDAKCANGGPGGLPQADTFLKQWVPQIVNSPAFQQQDGLLIVTFDEALTSDTSACCGEIPGPGSASPGSVGGSGAGGGDTGAVLLSPCIAPGTVTQTPYNHYTMLRSVEDIFGLPHIAYAGLTGETSFGSDIFTRACTPSPPVVNLRGPTLASSAGTGPTLHLSWAAADPSGTAGVAFNVQVQSAGATTWTPLLSASTATSLIYKAALGKSYTFRVQAVNGDGQSSTFAMLTTIVPSGASVHGGHYSGGWHLRRVKGAWNGHAEVASAVGARFTLRYSGGVSSLIGERTRSGGKATVTLDGHKHAVSFRGKRSLRAVVFRGKAKNGHHTLSLRVTRGTVAIEGVGIAR